VELHQVALGAAAVEPGVAEVVPEPVREYLEAALAAPPDGDLVDPAGRHRPPVAGPEPQLRPPCLGVPGADARYRSRHATEKQPHLARSPNRRNG